MATDFTVYIGAYLRVRSPLTREIIDMCKTHGRPDDADFCPKCGRPRATRHETHSIAADWSFWESEETIDRLVEVLATEDEERGERTFYAVTNFRTCAAGLSFDRWSESQAAGMPDEVKCCAEILREHQSDIDTLTRLGCEVTVAFGVLATHR